MRLLIVSFFLVIPFIADTGCKKKDLPAKTPSPAIDPIDSAQTPLPRTYPYTERFDGVLTKNINGRRIDSDYTFYVIHPNKDSLIFKSAGAINEEWCYRRLYLSYSLDSSGVYYFDNYYVIDIGDDPHLYFDPATIQLRQSDLNISWTDFFYENYGDKSPTPNGGDHSVLTKCTYYGKLSRYF